MRQLGLGAMVLVVGSAMAPLHAGVYQTVDPLAGPSVTKDSVEPMPFLIFRDDVILGLPLIQVDKPDNQVRNRYLALLDQLHRKERSGQATEEDLVNLSTVLIRLGQPDKVIQLLTPHARKRNANFMVLANLATANYLMAGPKELTQYTQALDYLDFARAEGLAEEWPGFTVEQLRWYKQTEEVFQRLLRTRLREAAKPESERTGLDPLFGPRDNPVRFVGESGAYEPGKLAAAEQAKLPKDAVALMQQLLIWLPGETRLYWLYGELLNAQGDLKTSRDVLDSCIYARAYNSKELLEHRQQLDEALATAATDARRIGWLPESGQLVAVGGVAVVAILILVWFQFRELLRRRTGKG